MSKQEQVIVRLMAGWNGMVLGGLMTRDDLYDSLLAQILGEMDMSADELTVEMAELMGWDITDITMDQYKEWEHIVNMAATEYMYK